MQVLQLRNKQGRPVMNHFILFYDNKQYLQSYDSVICEWDAKKNTITLFNNYNYSNTTSKHLYKYLEDITGVNKDIFIKNIKAKKSVLVTGYKLKFIAIDKKI